MVDNIPNDAMVDEAQRGLDWRSEFGRGGTDVGIARARDIVNRRNLSNETIARMNSYLLDMRSTRTPRGSIQASQVIRQMVGSPGVYGLEILGDHGPRKNLLK
jgi:hypothetical protein